LTEDLQRKITHPENFSTTSPNRLPCRQNGEKFVMPISNIKHNIVLHLRQTGFGKRQNKSDPWLISNRKLFLDFGQAKTR
jgi:hypothetical protein